MTKKVSEYAIYALAVLIPVIVVPVNLVSPFDLPKVLALLAGVGLLVILNPEPLKRLPVPVILLLCLNAISLIYTKNLQFTIHFGALNVATLLLIIYTAEHINTPEKAKRLFTFICLGGVVSVIPAFMQYQGINLLSHGTSTPIGTVGNSNFFGTYLVFPLIALAGLFYLEEKKRNKYGLVLVWLILFGAFLLARCRSSWLAFGIVVIPFLWFVPTKKDLAIGLFFGMIVTLAVSATIFPKSFLHWTETNTLKERYKYWQAAEFLIRGNPVYGHGIESYRNLVYEAQAKVGEIDPGYWPDYEVPKPRHPHNQYLEILVDGGLIAAGILVWFLWLFLKPAWKCIRECAGDKRLVLGVAFFSIMAMLVSMFFYFPLKESTTLCMIGLMFGVMAGISGVTDKSQMTLKSPLLIRLVLAAFAVIIVSHVAVRPIMADHYSYKSMISTQPEQKMNYLLKAIRYSPNGSEYWQHLGLLMLFQKRDPVAARDFFERALLPFNGNIVQWSPHYFIAISNLLTKQPKEAQASLATALHYYPNHDESLKLMARIKTVLANAEDRK